MKYRVLLSLFMLSFMGISQSSKEDSLIKIVNSAKDDTTKVNLLYQLSEICEEKDILKYCLPGLALAKKSEYKKGMAAHLNNIGYYYYFVAYDAEKALDNYNRALILNRELKNYPAQAVTLYNMGLLYRNIGSAEQALDCLLEVTKIREKTGDISGLAKAVNYTGTIYEKMNLHKEALECHLKAYELQQTIKDEVNIPATLSNIARIYEVNHMYDKAEDYYKKAVGKLNSMELSLNTKKDLSQALFQLGDLYMRKGQYDQSLEYFNNSLAISREIDNQHAIAYSYIGIGKVRCFLKKNEEAISYLERAFTIGSRSNYPEVVGEASESLSKMYENSNDFEKALHMHKLFKQWTDSFSSANVRDAVLKKQMEYVFAKKEEALKSDYEKEKTKQEYEKNTLRLILTGLTILFILILIIGALVFRQSKLKSQFQSMQLEQKLLRSQMNPHFIYNCLQSIQNFIHDKKAERYLSSFGTLARSVLENSRLESIPLYKEIELLEHYLQLQKLLYEDRFEYKLNISPDVDVDNIFIPPMISQPFIENAIEHGFRSIEKGGLLLVSFSLVNDMLQLDIKDNGTGMENEINKQHQSMATYITKERIDLLNKRKKDKTSFSITEAYPDQANKGVKVTFTIPLK
jgi:tetratricopeptide (TPR) repeat protein